MYASKKAPLVLQDPGGLRSYNRKAPRESPRGARLRARRFGGFAATFDVGETSHSQPSWQNSVGTSYAPAVENRKKEAPQGRNQEELQTQRCVVRLESPNQPQPLSVTAKIGW